MSLDMKSKANQTQLVVLGSVAERVAFDQLCALNERHGLLAKLSFEIIDKPTDKTLLRALKDADRVDECPKTMTLVLNERVPYLLIDDKNNIIKSALNWQSLAHRIVNAGRKSEMLLQASKLTKDMRVIDATAGFGYDGLLLASTGACVCMVERHPVVALLLFFEHQRMHNNVNWHKLLSRISICHADFLDEGVLGTDLVDLVYLDPMFPQDSYTSKVNKSMQLLHQMASAPSTDDEWRLLTTAVGRIHVDGKVIVKRPLSAPVLAKGVTDTDYPNGICPYQSISNNAIRFDKYQNKHQK